MKETRVISWWSYLIPHKVQSKAIYIIIQCEKASNDGTIYNSERLIVK